LSSRSRHIRANAGLGHREGLLELETKRVVSFAFASGAMLALIVAEMLPRAYEASRPAEPSCGLCLGAAVMLALSNALGV
jgi:zinc transporter ZupT